MCNIGPETEPFTHQKRSRTSETRYHRRTNNWQGHTRTKKNTYMNKFYTKNQSTLTLFNQAPPVGRPYTNSVPLTMQSQVSKSRNVTLFFKTGDALKVSGHALFTEFAESSSNQYNNAVISYFL